MSRILWIATGGTISCVSSAKGLVPAADEEQLKFIKNDLGLECDSECIMNIDSSDLSYRELEAMADRVKAGIDEGYHGIILTHGTDTMAFTVAYLNGIFCSVDIPIVLTGSQFPYTETDSDAPENMRLAYRTAMRDDISGVFVTFGRKVMKSGGIYKNDSRGFDAFESSTDTNSVQSEQPVKIGKAIHPGIGVLYVTPFTSQTDVENFSGYDGVVICAYGTGNVPNRLVEPIKQLSVNTRVMIVSQCRKGGTVSGRYAVSGELSGKNIVFGGRMTIEEAVISLACDIDEAPSEQ